MPLLRCVLNSIPLHAYTAERLSFSRGERSPLHGLCTNVHAESRPHAASAACLLHFLVQNAVNRAREQGKTCTITRIWAPCSPVRGRASTSLHGQTRRIGSRKGQGLRPTAQAAAHHTLTGQICQPARVPTSLEREEPGGNTVSLHRRGACPSPPPLFPALPLPCEQPMQLHGLFQTRP